MESPEPVAASTPVDATPQPPTGAQQSAGRELALEFLRTDNQGRALGLETSKG